MIATWTSLTASAVTAAATIVLAIVGWRAFALSRRLVEATQSQAAANEQLAEETASIIEQNRDLIAASLREAEALEQQAEAARGLLAEARRDRELAHQPHLVMEANVPSEFIGEPDGVLVRNIGSGPAVNCRAAHHEFSGDPATLTSWGSRLFDLGVGESTSLFANEGHWQDNVLDGLLGDGSLTVDACCRKDQFGNRFRVAAGFKMRRSRQEQWRPGEPESKWASWYMPLR